MRDLAQPLPRLLVTSVDETDNEFDVCLRESSTLAVAASLLLVLVIRPADEGFPVIRRVTAALEMK